MAITLLGIAIAVVAGLTITELEIVQDPVGPRGFAYMVGGFCAVGGAALFVRQLRRWSADDPALTEEGTDDEPDVPASAARAFTVMGLSIVYAAFLPLLGYLLVTPLYIVGLLAAMGVRRRVRMVLYALTYTVATFVLFALGLGVRMPTGPAEALLDAVGVL